MTPNVPTSRKRILIVTHVVPASTAWGFSTRILNLVEQLAKTHDVSLLCYREPGDDDGVARLRTLVDQVHTVDRPVRTSSTKRRLQMASMLRMTPFQQLAVRSEAMQRALDSLLDRTSYDIVQIETTHLADLTVRPGIPVVLDEHNIEYELFARMARAERRIPAIAYYGIEAAKLYRAERRHWRTVTGCVTTSAREQRIVRCAAPGLPVASVPNGVDLRFFAPVDIKPIPGRMVFTGLMSYKPNIDALQWFVAKVLPRVRAELPEAHLFAVGQAVSEEVASLASDVVTVTGFVPDVRRYFSEAAVVVVPLRMGSGTRLKVVEALAMGRPLVSTTIGVEGIDVTDGHDVLLADRPESMASQIVRAMRSPSVARQLATNGRSLVEERYGWEACGAALDAFYDEVLDMVEPDISADSGATPRVA